MSEDNWPRVSSSESMSSSDSSTTKQRRKRKWDQPAESLGLAGVAVPGAFPVGNMGSLVSITHPGVASVSCASIMNHVPASPATFQQVLMVPSLQQHAAALVQKINQPKIQDELIAREIIINDAEPSIRCKLTKRQTQEEIQNCTGAVVITRGKYRPPNGPPDGEKPLYLHISAGSHLESTADRIKAVDHAAAMVEEMLKQNSLNNGTKPLSTCVFLGFEADPTLNIAARIRGPNDQYVNHIMNETEATVLLRGCGSENPENSLGEEGQQPLHLFLSSNNPKSLEHAKLLADNLLDTICSECGASRISSSKVYGAVPPPQQLLAGVPSGNELKENTQAASLTADFIPVPTVSPVIVPGVTTFVSQGTIPQPLGLPKFGQSQPNMVCYPQPSSTGGTSYNGYGGIYPQATPLQQVALALRQSASPVTSTVSLVALAATTASTSSTSFSSEKEKRPPQKRKFQELPVFSKEPPKHDQNLLQDSKFLKPHDSALNTSGRNISTMPAPKVLVRQSSNGITPAPPMCMPPPPPKFNSSTPVPKVPEERSKSETVPDTLIRLMEYGDEDEDEDDTEETFKCNTNVPIATKPFWAV